MLDGDGVGVGVEIRHRLVLGDPAAVDLVRDHQLPGLVVELEIDVLAEVGQRDLGAQRRAEVPDQTGPVMEVQVLGQPALQRDGVVFVPARRFVGCRWVAAARDAPRLPWCA